MPVRAAVYLRHSTDKTKTENQLPDVQQIVTTRGYKLAHVFEEGASAVKKRRGCRSISPGRIGSRVTSTSAPRIGVSRM